LTSDSNSTAPQDNIFSLFSTELSSLIVFLFGISKKIDVNSFFVMSFLLATDPLCSMQDESELIVDVLPSFFTATIDFSYSRRLSYVLSTVYFCSLCVFE